MSEKTPQQKLHDAPALGITSQPHKIYRSVSFEKVKQAKQEIEGKVRDEIAGKMGEMTPDEIVDLLWKYAPAYSDILKRYEEILGQEEGA